LVEDGKRVWVVVETDNFGRYYFNEKILNILPCTKKQAEAIADAINDAHSGGYQPRSWVVRHKEDA
jgi:hypothetical protein